MVVGEFTVETELLVIGAGPGGCAAALRARELGAAVTIVDDRSAPGGQWLHTSCVPSRELLGLAQLMRAAEEIGAWGIDLGAPRIDLDRLRAALAARIGRLAGTIDEQCRDAGITMVQGHATFENSRQVAIAGNVHVPRIRFRRALLATGASDTALDGIIRDDRIIIGPARALALEEIPATLLVVGSGPSAVELATIMHALGSRVTLVDVSEHLALAADPSLIAPLRARLDATLDAVALGVRLASFEADDDGVTVSYEGANAPSRTRFDRVLLAVGRSANTAGLGLERTAVEFDADGFVRTDATMQTTDPRIFAVGDVTGPPHQAVRAMHQGRIAAECLAGWKRGYDVHVVPIALFTVPQVAWCGLTETDAVARGIPYAVREIPWSQRPQTGLPGHEEALTRIVYDPDTRLIHGVGIVGPNAADLIGEGALAIEMGAVLDDLAGILHPHPTGSATLGMAAQAAVDATDAADA